MLIISAVSEATTAVLSEYYLCDYFSFLVGGCFCRLHVILFVHFIFGLSRMRSGRRIFTQSDFSPRNAALYIGETGDRFHLVHGTSSRLTHISCYPLV